MIDRDLVWHKLDIDNPPPLSEEQREELRRLAAIDDDQIDVSDIPPLDEDFWKRARPFREVLEERRRAAEARQAQVAKTAAE